MEKSSLDFNKDVFDLWAKAYQATYGRFIEMPALGPNREKIEEMRKNFDANLGLYASWLRSSASFQSVLAEATRKTREKIAEVAAEEGAEETPKDFYKVWLETYSDTFKEFLKSEDFSEDLGQLTSDLMDTQMSNQDMLEKNLLKPMNLPTRTEINEINKEVYTLRKKVKSLTKQVERLSKQG
jgi:class III poly(R)-hydroxyalkanoic acid synthase PhaE subunit